MKPHLVLLRAGPAPLPALAAEALVSPNFDLALSWNGSQAPSLPGAAFVHACAGARWPALVQALAAHAQQVASYRYVWLPEDGVQGTPEDVARLFAICEHLGLDLAQPAFTPSSPCVHPIAWQHGEFQVRFTNYVDPAAAVFSADMLARVLPTLDSADAGALLGRIWPQLSRLGRVAIVDATPVTRSAPAAAVDVAAASVVAARHFVDPGAALNLGGLLDSGDALCLGDRPAEVDALLEALIRSCRTLPLDASGYTRYLARHLDFAATDGVGAAGFARSAIRVVLEHELAAAGIQFNRVLAVRGDAAAVAPAFAPPSSPSPAPATTAPAVGADSDAARQLALRDADLRDLRERYQTVVAERERQDALLAELGQRFALALHARAA